MKPKKQVLFLLLVLGASFVMEAQIRGGRSLGGGFATTSNKKKYAEIIFGVGVANFLGDVGGANAVGTNFVRDLNFVATRPSAQLAYRVKFDRHWAVKGGFYYEMVSGADKYTKEMYRNNRNLSFRTNIYEVSGQVEFYFTKAEQLSKRYKIKGTKKNSIRLQGYLFLGVGAFFFNPKAQYDGKWIALQPLGTEGEGLPGGGKKYSRVSVAIPYGIGFKQEISNKLTLGVEFGFRKTYTDYIDDVSGTYYDNTAILQQRGATAAYLADPKLHNVPYQIGGGNDSPSSKTGNQGGAGQQRGDPRDKDAYMFVNITLGYRIPYKKFSLNRNRNHFLKISQAITAPANNF